MTDELGADTAASEDAGQPAGVTTAQEAAPPVPLTLAELRASHPELVSEIESEARREYLAAHPAPSAGARALIDAAREQGVESATVAERTRILSIVGHTEAQGKRDIAIRLAGMPSMTVETAAELLAGMPKAAATGPAAEFAAVLAKCGPPPVDEGDELQQYLGRVRQYEAAMLAEEHATRVGRGR